MTGFFEDNVFLVKILWILALSITLALFYSAFVVRYIVNLESGTQKMQEIAGAILQGAVAYLSRQYRSITIVGSLIFVAVWLLLSFWHAIGFAVGAILSGLTGYIGMHVSVRANVRTAHQAKISLNSALNVAFKGGSVTGLLVVGLGLLGIVGYYLTLRMLHVDSRVLMESLVALSFGASLISIFARLGGGIFTKGADIGADLVGKLEAGIPEDDPRNPAVIADNVGDNVGDCAGMAADLFETYVVTIVATMFLADSIALSKIAEYAILYPILISAVCIIGSILGTFFVKSETGKGVMSALYRCLLISAVSSAILIFFVTKLLMPEFMMLDGVVIAVDDIRNCAFVGLLLTGLMMWFTEYYTSSSYNPVDSIARSSQTGHATNIIQGLAVSMESTVLPAIAIVVSLITSFNMAGLYGIAIAATSMLALTGVIVALDAYGPITDNAGGIAEMSGLSKEVREITDSLDAVGNTTKAVTKGYAIASAGLASIVLFSAYMQDLEFLFPHIKVIFELNDPFVVGGLILGGLLPYWFSAFGMRSVSKAGTAVVEEVRKQFRENPGIMDGSVQPNYASAVDILTSTAIKEMILPSLLPVVAPIVLWLVAFFAVGQIAAFKMLGALLMGIIVTGIFVAISMTVGGGAWDNAKKLIEDGNYGGKNSEAHKAAITGDTVGDPCKDTVGPAINPMIKIANIIALLLLVFLSKVLK